MKQMKTLTVKATKYEIVDEAARASVDELRGDVTGIIQDSLVDFVGATTDKDGVHGLVPAPSAGDENKCLMGNGEWAEVADKKVEARVTTLETDTGTLRTDLNSHTVNKSNPHSVTLEQLGVTATKDELNIMDGVTATTDEINKLDGFTGTASKLNYINNVTGDIQSQIDSKAAINHGTHVTYGTTVSELNDVSSAGSASDVSRSDHVHPFPALDNCSGYLSIAKGGTGAASASGARMNLGFYSGNELPDPSEYEEGSIFFLHG